MVEILARCGYRCDLCPAYAGNIHSARDRQNASDGWYKYAGFRVPPEKINCPGCSGDNQPQDKDCPVRPCVIQKGIDNCGYCRDMPCDKLKTRMNFFQEHIKHLSSVPRDDFKKFIQPYISKDRLLKIHSSIRKTKPIID